MVASKAKKWRKMEKDKSEGTEKVRGLSSGPRDKDRQRKDKKRTGEKRRKREGWRRPDSEQAAKNK